MILHRHDLTIIFLRDSQRIKIWNTVATGVHRIVKTCKMVELKANWVMFLQYIPTIVKLFISLGMPILEHNLKYHVEEIEGTVKQLQGILTGLRLGSDFFFQN